MIKTRDKLGSGKELCKIPDEPPYPLIFSRLHGATHQQNTWAHKYGQNGTRFSGKKGHRRLTFASN